MGLVLWGADRFTEASIAVARRYRISELIIGLSVVAVGTSLPEFMVSLLSALRGSSDMSIGNIMGSNIFNALVIVGASSMILPLSVSRRVRSLDIPVTVGVSVILVILGCQGGLSRWDGVLLVLLFISYVAWTIRDARRHPSEDNVQDSIMSPLFIIAWLIVGVACLVIGARVMVDNAVLLAQSLGVSQRIIAITILAAGTSLPEFATSIVAACKGRQGLAMGNVLGSNIFNVLFAIGPCAIIRPLSMDGLRVVDFAYFIGSVFLLLVFSLFGDTFGRWKGGVLIASYVVYIMLLLTY